jgi:hypothetical protein
MSGDKSMHRNPNKVTVKAIKQSESGNGIQKFETLDDFFESLVIVQNPPKRNAKPAEFLLKRLKMRHRVF